MILPPDVPLVCLRMPKKIYPSVKERKKAEKLRKLYGLSYENYLEMLIAQDLKCKICGIPLEGLKRKPSVDHDHVSGKVRGLLCVKCNTIIGFANDDIDILLKAIAYLKA